MHAQSCRNVRKNVIGVTIHWLVLIFALFTAWSPWRGALQEEFSTTKIPLEHRNASRNLLTSLRKCLEADAPLEPCFLGVLFLLMQLSRLPQRPAEAGQRKSL